MHRQFCSILSQKPEYVQTHCNDRNNSFHFALPKWISENSSIKCNQIRY